MVLPEKNLSSPPPQKKKGPGASPFCEKKLWPSTREKKELAPFEIENRGASFIRQGQTGVTREDGAVATAATVAAGGLGVQGCVRDTRRLVSAHRALDTLSAGNGAS